MNLPDGEVIGVSTGRLVLQGARIEAVVPTNPAVVQDVVAHLASKAKGTAAQRVYLALENIRGTRDASVLRVSIQLPGRTAAGEQQEFRAGSVGLYGLRRASAGHAAENAERGLGFVLDISSFFESSSVANTSSIGELVVVIQPNHELPAGTSVTIGRLRIFREHGEAGNLPQATP